MVQGYSPDVSARLIYRRGKPPRPAVAPAAKSWKRFRQSPVVAVALLVLAGFAGCYAWLSMPLSPLGACERAIKESLPAPATYRRIDASCSGGSCSIAYEALNSFGVTSRKEITCSIAPGSGDVSLYGPIPTDAEELAKARAEASFLEGRSAQVTAPPDETE